MEAVGGDLADHDWENDEAAWFPADAAPAAMAFPNEAEIVRRALALLPPRQQPHGTLQAPPA
jgi:hypothetical protein